MSSSESGGSECGSNDAKGRVGKGSMTSARVSMMPRRDATSRRSQSRMRRQRTSAVATRLDDISCKVLHELAALAFDVSARTRWGRRACRTTGNVQKAQKAGEGRQDQPQDRHLRHLNARTSGTSRSTPVRTSAGPRKTVRGAEGSDLVSMPTLACKGEPHSHQCRLWKHRP